MRQRRSVVPKEDSVSSGMLILPTARRKEQIGEQIVAAFPAAVVAA